MLAPEAWLRGFFSLGVPVSFSLPYFKGSVIHGLYSTGVPSEVVGTRRFESFESWIILEG